MFGLTAIMALASCGDSSGDGAAQAPQAPQAPPAVPVIPVPNPSDAVEPEPKFQRGASALTDVVGHSGHSLTDAYLHQGEYPGNFIRLVESVSIPGAADKHIKATIPGSPMSWRWSHDGDLAAGSRPRENAGNFDSLMITEAGPPPRVTDGISSVEREWTFDYWMRFVANQIEHGRGNEIILWSIWPDLRGPGVTDESAAPADWAGFTFHTGLPEYGRTFKYMADYASWKAKQLYPSLPSDWRIWIIPGHKWMERVYGDVQLGRVPGVTAIEDLFGDNIHPTSVASYGLACLAVTALYQVNLSEKTGVYIQPAHTSTNGLEPAVTRPQAEYFWRIAWEIATDYEPAGMGGTSGAEPAWTLAKDGDLMPNWTLAAPDINPTPRS